MDPTAIGVVYLIIGMLHTQFVMDGGELSIGGCIAATIAWPILMVIALFIIIFRR